MSTNFLPDTSGAYIGEMSLKLMLMWKEIFAIWLLGLYEILMEHNFTTRNFKYLGGKGRWSLKLEIMNI